MHNEQMQEAIKILQDAMVVMAHVEKRQDDRIAQTDKLNGLIGYIAGQGPGGGLKQ